MDIGISSACFYPEITTECTVGLCKDLGFNLMELFLESPYEYSNEFITQLKCICEEKDMNIYSVHAFSGSFEPYLFDLYKRRRDDMLKLFKSVCAAGKILGAKCYVFHGLRRAISGQAIDCRHVAMSMDVLADIAGENGMFLAWENVSWCQTYSPSFLYEVLQHINSNNLKFTLDLKQARKSGYGSDEYINVMRGRIVNVHINDGDEVNTCLLPGDGNSDLRDICSNLKKSGYDGPFIIEVYSHNYNDYGDIRKAREHLKSILK